MSGEGGEGQKMTRRDFLGKIARLGAGLGLGGLANFLSGCGVGQTLEGAATNGGAKGEKGGVAEEKGINIGDRLRQWEEEKEKKEQERLALEEALKRKFTQEKRNIYLEARGYEPDLPPEQRTGWKAPEAGLNVRLLPDENSPVLGAINAGEPIRGINYAIIIREQGQESVWFAVAPDQYTFLTNREFPGRGKGFKFQLPDGSQREYLFVCQKLRGEEILKDKILLK